MAGLQRFITYIYKYENDEKKENAGFAKIEIRNGICRMEVHIRNMNPEHTKATVYLFAEKENIIQGVPVGELTFSKGNGDIRYTFETKDLGSFGMTISDMEGIFIPLEDSLYLASRWKEGKIAQGRFRIMEKKQKEDSREENEQTSAESEIRDATARETKSEEPETESERKIKGLAKTADASGQKAKKAAETAGISEQKAEKAAETAGMSGQAAEISAEGTGESRQKEAAEQTKQPIRATELPLEEFFEESGWRGVFQKLRLKSEVFFPFEGQEIECIRMQLNDLHEFPKKYWYIGNNSFLLHGFFNYRHIIFGEMEERGEKRYFIGVPGVFMNQERIMAAMFGFPEFRTAKTTEYKTGNFGYWYRII